MNQFYRSATLIITVSALLSGCSTTPEKTADTAETSTVLVNDYPTRDRVEYVLNCVAKHGGLSYINQYACGCKVDKLAEQLSFKEYDEARTFTQLYSTPGEKGGVFRDPKQSKTLRDRLKEAEAAAEKACFVK
ncbi:MAG: hypothetical protein NTV00_11390 [Methylococcales bacterium]|nr:hypothetical protein [Methylococcales bacterium]